LQNYSILWKQKKFIWPKVSPKFSIQSNLFFAGWAEPWKRRVRIKRASVIVFFSFAQIKYWIFFIENVKKKRKTSKNRKMKISSFLLFFFNGLICIRDVVNPQWTLFLFLGGVNLISGCSTKLPWSWNLEGNLILVFWNLI